MPPRSQLEINTSSVLRLVKEEASYHREAVEQAERIKKLENDKSEDENREYLLQQEVCLPTPDPPAQKLLLNMLIRYDSYG
jgi:hypothetical protein